MRFIYRPRLLSLSENTDKDSVEKSSKSKFKLDFWLILGALSIMGGLTFVLFRYQKWLLEPAIRRQEPREKVAIVTSAKKDSKRRYAGSLTYFDLAPSENINLGDTIFVDANSSLEVKLASGSTIRFGSMTLVLVDQENNNIKFILNNGEVNAATKNHEVVHFDINEEPLEVEGQKNSQFKVKKAELGETSVTGKQGQVKIKFRDQTIDVTDREYKLNTPKAPKTDLAQELAKNKLPEEPAKPQPKAPNLASETVIPEDVPLDLPIPYPNNQQLFLIKTKASILVMPKRICANSCRMALLKNGTEVGHWDFKKQTPPLLKLPFTPQDKGLYTVRLIDGNEPPSESQFTVEEFSPPVFEQAIKKGLSVELLD